MAGTTKSTRTTLSASAVDKLRLLTTSRIGEEKSGFGTGLKEEYYEEERAIASTPYIQLISKDRADRSQVDRIPAMNADFRNAYTSCGERDGIGEAIKSTKATINRLDEANVSASIGWDDKYATIHWDEYAEEYFWGAEGTANCYIGKHLGKGVGEAGLELGSYNVGAGVESGYNMAAADYNVWAGFQAFYQSKTPKYSVAVGYQAGYNTDAGTGNTFVGAKSGFYTDDLVKDSETLYVPTWSRLVEFAAATSPPESKMLCDLDGELIIAQKHETASPPETEILTSPDGITWTSRDSTRWNATTPANYWFSTSAHFMGKAWFNIYDPDAAGESWLLSWDGTTAEPKFLYDTYHPLSPRNIYVSRLFVFNGMLFAATDQTYSESIERRAVYWSSDGEAWTKVTNYGSVGTTYYDYASSSEPNIASNLCSKANRLVEFGGDLYWVCSRYESSLWHTKILKLSSDLTIFTVVGDITPDYDYLHPMAVEVIGDTCYVFLQELAASGGFPTSDCRLLLYTSQDMINWTFRKDYGDVGVISDSIWFEKELLICRVSSPAATRGQVFVDRIDISSYAMTTENTISTNTSAVCGADLYAFAGELYLGKNLEVHKRTRTSWITDWEDLDASHNTFIGEGAGYYNAFGRGNTALGAFANFPDGNLHNATAIGFMAQCTASNTIVLGGTGNYAVKVGIGRTMASYTLDIMGDLRVSDNIFIDVATGTIPINVNSTTMCPNLNADMVDGMHAGDFPGSTNLDGGYPDTTYIPALIIDAGVP